MGIAENTELAVFLQIPGRTDCELAMLTAVAGRMAARDLSPSTATQAPPPSLLTLPLPLGCSIIRVFLNIRMDLSLSGSKCERLHLFEKV